MSTEAAEREQTLRAVRDEFQAMEALTGRFSDAAQELLGISAPHLAALRGVMLGARKVADVASYTRSHVSSASRAVDQLVEADLISRVEDPSDRRAVILGLTAHGRELMSQLEDQQTEVMQVITEGLALDDLLTFTRVLAHLRAGAAAAIDNTTA